MTEIFLYDEIGPGSGRAFLDDLQAAGKGPVRVRINSPGGDLFQGLSIANAIRSHGRVTCQIDGLAASIASLIAVSGSRVVMTADALLMIHDPWSMATGTAAELRQQAEGLDRAAAALVAGYAQRQKVSEAQASAWMAAETWFTADEAQAAGLVDEIIPLDSRMAASLRRYDLTQFANAPRGVFPMTGKTTPPVTEGNPATPAQPQAPASQPQPPVIPFVARLRHRNEALASTIGPFLAREGVRDVYEGILADPHVTLEQARERILAKLGEGAEPLTPPGYAMHMYGGPEGLRGNHVGWAGDQRMADFKAGAIDAILLSNGVPLAKPHPAAQDLRGMAAVEMLACMLRAGGRSTNGMAKSDIIRASMSTSDLPYLLEGVANKSLQHGYDSEPASHRQWVRMVEVPDFKTNSRPAISEAPGLLEVPELAEYKNGSLVDARETYSIATYGRLLALSRQMLINDDLGALTRLAMAFGASGARKEADLVYAILTVNAALSDSVALFHADHGNLASAAALSVASLGVARAAMRVQTGLAGEAILNLVPRYLIVPAALETTAEQLLASLVDPSKNNQTPNLAWVRGLTLVVDARLDADSTTAWYLAADFNQVDTIELAHLASNSRIETLEEQEFNRDVWRIKARLDCGTKAIDYRGLLKNPGA